MEFPASAAGKAPSSLSFIDENDERAYMVGAEARKTHSELGGISVRATQTKAWERGDTCSNCNSHGPSPTLSHH
jgi:hypothetical protein